MHTLEFTEQAGEDGIVRLNIPVDTAGKRYHVVVHLHPAEVSANEPEYLSDEFVKGTAGKWIGEFPLDSEGGYEERSPL